MKKIATTLLLLILTGCVATGPIFERTSEPGADGAIAYIYRQSSSYGYASCPKLMIDNERVGCLKNGGFIEVRIDPGQHEVWFSIRRNRDNDLIANIDAEAGMVYFYEYGQHLTDMSVIGSVALVSGGESFAQKTEEYSIPVLENLKDSSD